MIKDNKPKYQQFKTYIEQKEIAKLRSLISKYYVVDIVENVLSNLEIDEIIKLLRMMSMDDAADLFSHLDTELSHKIIDKLKTEEIKELLNEIVADDIVELIEEWPENIVEKVLYSVSKDKRENINSILRYEEDQVGYHMSVDYVSLTKTMTIKQVIQHIKKFKDKSPIDALPFTYFVIDKNKDLIGYVDYESLLLKSSSTKIEKICKPAIFVHTHDDITIAIDIFKKYELETLAVLNHQNKVSGIIESADILQAVEEEYIEDMGKLSGISETEKNYLIAKPRKIILSRTPWLVGLLFLGTLTQFIVQWFTQSIWHLDEGTSVGGVGIASTAFVTAISVVPIMIDSGGNAGGQASATIIRSLATKEIETSDWKKIIKKEMIVASAIGFMMFIGNFIRMILVDIVMYQGYTNLGSGVDIEGLMIINFVTSISLYFAMFIANFFGSMAPLLARRLNLDEASVSAPLITTILDILIVFVYFGLISITFIVII